MGEHITIGQSLLITVFSMLVVFVVLLGISYLIELLRIATNGEDKKKTQDIKTEKIETKEEISTEENLDDEELVAVIAAAIAASMGVEIPDINIRSIRRASSTSPIWAETGRREYISGKL